MRMGSGQKPKTVLTRQTLLFKTNPILDWCSEHFEAITLSDMVTICSSFV